jgi:tRNA1Val (adenine37-N6)-methyltransferase
MKISSDAVLMGSLLNVSTNASTALEIGTGSGVISLMLIQRYPLLNIKALEIDVDSAIQAAENFSNSSFIKKPEIDNIDFLSIDINHQYDLIFSNPPYFYHSLKNEDQQKSIARHISWQLFANWLDKMNELSHSSTEISLILPVEAFDKTDEYLSNLGYQLIYDCSVRSFEGSAVIRKLSTWTKANKDIVQSEFVIYKSEKTHSDQYIEALKDFLIIF